ncbi:MAG: DAK2 domain-containing protein [Gammaproteobacteria bacterium]
MHNGSQGVRYLDGIRLNRCLCASIDWVINAQDHLNKINVFPVPDGDTGTNLAVTVNSIGVCIQQLDTRHAGELLVRAADAALDGARGNSGAIIAQFFQGLADSCEDRPRLLPEDLVRGFRTGGEYARAAIAEPKPGTILTVIDEVAEYLADHHRKHQHADFVPLLTHALEYAQGVLARTQEQLDVLRRAGVVDAGAKGFLLLLEGIGNFLARGSLRAVPVPRADPGATEGLGGYDAHDGDIEHHYCTECLIVGEQIDQRKLRERLSAIGSSLIIAGTPRKTKVHVHVDEPAAVFEIAGAYGELTGCKADDMRRQASAVGAGHKRYVIITDSAADLPDNAMEDLDINIVPLRIQFGSASYLDRVGMTPQQFYDEMRTNDESPRTSQPAPGDYRRMYDFLSSHYEHVFCISVSRKVSGTWQAAHSAAERARRPDAITVIDSQSASLGQGLIAMHAAECVAAGMDGDRIAGSIEAIREKTRTFGLITDLSHAVRGGRVHPAMHRLARILHIHPILQAPGDGRVKPGGFIFGGPGTLPRFARYVGKRLVNGSRYRLGIAHANNAAAATEVLDRLLARNPNIVDSYITEMGVALGVHTGPGAIAAAVQEYTPPD